MSENTYWQTISAIRAKNVGAYNRVLSDLTSAYMAQDGLSNEQAAEKAELDMLEPSDKRCREEESADERSSPPQDPGKLAHLCLRITQELMNEVELTCREAFFLFHFR